MIPLPPSPHCPYPYSSLPSVHLPFFPFSLFPTSSVYLHLHPLRPSLSLTQPQPTPPQTLTFTFTPQTFTFALTFTYYLSDLHLHLHLLPLRLSPSPHHRPLHFSVPPLLPKRGGVKLKCMEARTVSSGMVTRFYYSRAKPVTASFLRRVLEEGGKGGVGR